MKHRGTLSELKAVVTDCNLEGEWSYREQNRLYVFHAASGEIVNWWPRTAAVNVQGDANIAMAARLDKMLSKCRRQSALPVLCQ
jgi:hypothetical protein